MGVSKYFIPNVTYGTEDMNEIVSDLRTTGVYGDIADCLKVIATTGTTVNILDGKGWVEGCKIVVSGTESITLPTVNGNYSIIMKLTKTGGVITDISLAYENGQTVGAHVLAWVTVSGDAITNVTDKRVNSTFKGVTQVYPSHNSGSVTYNETLATTTTKLINIGAGYTHGKAVIYPSGDSGGVTVFFGTDKEKTSVIGYYYNGAYTYPASWTKTRIGAIVGGASNSRYGMADLNITDFYIDGNSIKFVVKGNLKYTIEWEVWQ